MKNEPRPSAHISGDAREHIGRSLNEFQQKLLEGGNSLKRLSEELLEFLRQTLSDEHNAHRADLQQLRAFMQSDLTRLQEQFESLETRLTKLNASAESLESGLDQRLSQMSSNIVRDTRKQLEAEANELLDEMTARGVSVLGKQLDEATGNMKIAQNGIVASTSESLKAEAGNALQAFEHSMHTTAKLSVERWRLKLAAGLNALAKNLGDQFNVDESSDNKSERRA